MPLCHMELNDMMFINAWWHNTQLRFHAWVQLHDYGIITWNKPLLSARHSLFVVPWHLEQVDKKLGNLWTKSSQHGLLKDDGEREKSKEFCSFTNPTWGKWVPNWWNFNDFIGTIHQMKLQVSDASITTSSQFVVLMITPRPNAVEVWT